MRCSVDAGLESLTTVLVGRPRLDVKTKLVLNYFQIRVYVFAGYKYISFQRVRFYTTGDIFINFYFNMDKRSHAQ